MKKISVLLCLFLLCSMGMLNASDTDISKTLLLKENSQYDFNIDGYTIVYNDVNVNKCGVYKCIYKKDDVIYEKEVRIIKEEDLENKYFYGINFTQLNISYDEVIDYVNIDNKYAFLINDDNNYYLVCVNNNSILFKTKLNIYGDNNNFIKVIYDELTGLFYCAGYRYLVSYGFNCFFESIDNNGIIQNNFEISTYGSQFLKEFYIDEDYYYFVIETNSINGILSKQCTFNDVLVIKTNRTNLSSVLIDTSYSFNEEYVSSSFNDNKLSIITSDKDTDNYYLINYCETVTKQTLDNEYDYMSIYSFNHNYYYLISIKEGILYIDLYNYDHELLNRIVYHTSYSFTGIICENEKLYYALYDELLSSYYLYEIDEDNFILHECICNKVMKVSNNNNYVLLGSNKLYLHTNKELKVENNVVTYNNKVINKTSEYTNYNNDLFGVYHNFYVYYIDNFIFINEYDNECLLNTNLSIDNIYDIGFTSYCNGILYVDGIKVDSEYVFTRNKEYHIEIEGFNTPNISFDIRVINLSYEYYDNPYHVNYHYYMNKNEVKESNIDIKNNQITENLSSSDYLDKLWFLLIPVTISIITGLCVHFINKRS